jgi:hypothetical protein
MVLNADGDPIAWGTHYPDETTEIVRAINEHGVLREACTSALESIEITQKLLSGTPITLGVFEGAFVGVKRQLRAALAAIEQEKE